MMDTQALIRQFGDGILAITEFRDEFTITATPDILLDVCLFLKNDKSFDCVMLSDLCGLDRYPEEPRFAVVYNLFSLSYRHRLRLKVLLEGDSPRVDSVVSLWEGADWMERECFDLYGICFDKHPDLRRILLPDTFEGHPLRKDFPLEGFG